MKNMVANPAIPLYQKIYLDLKHQILTGKLKNKAKLPAEQDLCNSYNVSRITIRKSLKLLANDNLILTVQGKGSYVNHPKITSTLSRVQGFSDLVLPNTEQKKQLILKREVVQDPLIAKKLSLTSEADLFYIKRIFEISATPFTIDEAWLPAERFPELLVNVNDEISLYDYLANKYHEQASSSYREINTILPADEQKKLLNLTKTVPLFEVSKIVYNQFEQPFEFSHYVIRGDKMTYTVNSNSGQFHPKN